MCHAETLECRSFWENATYTRRWICGIVCGAIHDVEVWADRQTDRRTHTTTTVTIAVHAGRGLIIPDKDTWMVSCSFVCLRCVITLWVFVFGASAHFFIPLHFRGIMFVGINLLAHTLLVYIIIVLGCLHVKNILLINNLRLIVYSGQNFINRRFGNYIAAFFSLKYHGSEWEDQISRWKKREMARGRQTQACQQVVQACLASAEELKSAATTALLFSLIRCSNRSLLRPMYEAGLEALVSDTPH